MRKSFIMFLLIVGMTFILVSCQKADNNADNENDEKEKTDSLEVEGDWDGAIKVPDNPLHIIVSFHDNDTLSGEISIPTQGVDDYPLTVEEDDDELVFTMDLNGQKMTFEGDPEQEKITGTYTQTGREFPFELEKKEQTKSAEEREFLSIDTEDGTLLGELATPEKEGPYPVMLIIPGSGTTDRNGNTDLGENNSLKMVADTLAEQGIASLRYDKRGAGENKKAITEEEDLRFDLFLDDARGWVEMLKTDDRFSDIGIIGHSQGSLVGMVASENDAVDVFVSLAGAGSPFDELIYDQLEGQMPNNLLEESEEILASLKEGEVVEDVSEALYSKFRPSLQPFLSSLMEYNPTEEIKQLDIPTLVVNGTRDLQVPEEEADKLSEAKQDAELLIVDKMNHVLKEAPNDRGGNLETYWDSDRPLADGLMAGIMDFLEKVAFIE